MIEPIILFKKKHGRLPNITELAKLWGVTRNTVYSRLAKMEKDGLIKKTKVVITPGYDLV